MLILDFLAVAQQEGVLNQLDERRRKLIDAYFKTGAILESLKEVAGVGTRERVRQLIRSGIERLWETLPPSLQESYPQEKVIAILHSESKAKMREVLKAHWQDPEYRTKRTEALKGRKFTPEARTKMSKARKRWWANHKEKQG